MSDYEDLTSSCGADLSRPGVKNTTDYVEEVTDLESTECEEIAFYQNLLKQMEKSMQEIESVASANNSNQAHPSSNHGNMIGNEAFFLWKNFPINPVLPQRDVSNFLLKL